jgi:hypothetical protein
MTGLLMRLAARAVGTVPAVRPIVGWDTRADPAPLLLPSQPAVPTALPPSGEHRSSAAVLPATVVRPPMSEVDESFAAPLHGATPASKGEDRLDAAAQPPTAPAAVRSAPAPSVTASQPVLEPEAASDPRPRDRVAAFEPLLPQQAFAVAGRAPAKPIAPLFRPAGAGALRARASAAVAEDVTEVHVTIGRIELTAVQEAPRPRREPSGSRKPQSLEEYLTRRGTERR